MIPGRDWRILAHSGKRGMGDPIELHSAECKTATDPATDAGVSVFDELVIDHWFHLEQMDTDLYWVRVGPVDINVVVDRKTGGAKHISVEGA